MGNIMQPFKNYVWLCGLSIAIILLLSLQPTHIAALPYGDLTAAKSPSTNNFTSDLQANNEQDNAVNDYTIQPLGTSAQGEVGQSYAGLNSAQALRIVFNPNDLNISAETSGDLKWNVGLRLDSYTRGSNIPAAFSAASTVVDNNRIQYERDNISEWYINAPHGLKQGFTLRQPLDALSASGPLQLRLQTDGSLKPRMSIDGDAIDFVTENGVPLLRYDRLVVYDANDAMLPAELFVAGTKIVISIDDSNALYPITVDPLLTNYLSKQTAPDGAANDFLGYDVNVSQNIAIVGAYGDDNENGTDAGTAYIYAQDEGGANNWGQKARLVASDGQAGDQFGKDVYVHFGITVTVGAPGDDDKGDGAGAVYLFAHNQGGPDAWGELTKLTADNGSAGDGFGSAVSTQMNTTVVGAPGSNINGNDAGAVYVFEPVSTADPTVWSQTKVITAPDGAPGDGFGTAIVNSGDRLFVGAPGDDDACPANPDCNSGAIYIFVRDLGGPDQWGLLHKRTAPDASASALFGTSINISTDRVIVGAPGDDEKATDAGAAYIFEQDLGGIEQWQARPKLTAPDAAENDQFGRSVGIGGNIAMVGAPFDDDSGEDSGSAYLILFRGFAGQGAWGRSVKILASDGAAGDSFGASVDQRSGDIVIGSSMAGTIGAAYFYNSPFTMGTLQIASNVEPNDANTNWEYEVDGPLTDSQSLVGDSQTSPALVFPGTYTITETAGVDTDASLYSTLWNCSVNGESGPSGSGPVLTVFIGMLESVSCTFTHASPGTIIIQKQTKPEGGTGFNFTDNIAVPNSFTLDDDGTMTFPEVEPGSYLVTETVPADWRLTEIDCIDADGGSSGNGASAVIDMDAGESVTCIFINKTKNGISVVKSADAKIAGIGQTITYTYTVINDSPDDLTGVVAVDDILGPVTLGKTTLIPDEQTTGTLQYTVDGNDLPGPLTNRVVVTGTPPASTVVTDSASLSINLVGSASIAVVITANPTMASIEDSIEYSYRITNTGDAPLANVVAMDDHLGPIPLTDNTLQPGESTGGTLLYTIVEEDLPGPLLNTVTVTGEPPLGNPVEASDTATVAVVGQANILTTVSASTTSARVGDTITYTVQITNSGLITLTDVAASDNRLAR